jgi:hypothetical protein
MAEGAIFGHSISGKFQLQVFPVTDSMLADEYGTSR